MATGDKSLKGQMRQANSLGSTYAVILGKEEVSNRNAILRDMGSGDQQTVPLTELTRVLKQGQK
jgi:histidyl-tRNA synthetase